MLIEKENYKGFDISIYKTVQFLPALNVEVTSYKAENETFSTTDYFQGEDGKQQAVNRIKSEIDGFLSESPKTYEELSKAINDYIKYIYFTKKVYDKKVVVVNEKIVTHLVSEFIKNSQPCTQ
jgi:hypothetical protein